MKEMRIELERQLTSRRRMHDSLPSYDDEEDTIQRALNATLQAQNSRKNSKSSRKAFYFKIMMARKMLESFWHGLVNWMTTSRERNFSRKIRLNVQLITW